MSAFVVAIFAFIGSILGSFVIYRNNSKNILVQHVTGERAKWRNDMRNETCALVSQIRILADRPEDDDTFYRLQSSRTGLMLRLNPNVEKKGNELDREITLLLKHSKRKRYLKIAIMQSKPHMA